MWGGGCQRAGCNAQVNEPNIFPQVGGTVGIRSQAQIATATATALRSATATPTGTPTPTATPTTTATPTPTITPNGCIVNACSADFGSATGTLPITGTVVVSPCDGLGGPAFFVGCIGFTPSATGFQVTGVFSNLPAGLTQVTLTIPVTNAASLPAGSVTVPCPFTVSQGTPELRCSGTFTGVFPQAGGTVTAS